MKLRLMLFALAAIFGALSFVPESGGDTAAQVEAHPPKISDMREDGKPEFFSPREDSENFIYNMPFYPPGKTPPGELEYDPIPFEELLPRDSNAENPQPVATALPQ